jgi:hypothetical protein
MARELRTITFRPNAATASRDGCADCGGDYWAATFSEAAGLFINKDGGFEDKGDMRTLTRDFEAAVHGRRPMHSKERAWLAKKRFDQIAGGTSCAAKCNGFKKRPASGEGCMFT